MFRAVTDAVAILAKIRPLQGYVLHREECHLSHLFDLRASVHPNWSSRRLAEFFICLIHPLGGMKLALALLMDAAIPGCVSFFLRAHNSFHFFAVQDLFQAAHHFITL